MWIDHFSSPYSNLEFQNNPEEFRSDRLCVLASAERNSMRKLRVLETKDIHWDGLHPSFMHLHLLLYFKTMGSDCYIAHCLPIVLMYVMTSKAHCSPITVSCWWLVSRYINGAQEILGFMCCNPWNVVTATLVISSRPHLWSNITWLWMKNWIS